uniref:Uncharacterized protein n=1 Tax=Anguilla anguilla TaxID=7936 RepID=A0A0E9PQ39_ANGAN
MWSVACPETVEHVNIICKNTEKRRY